MNYIKLVLSKFDIDFDEKKLGLLHSYIKFIMEKNKSINLTGAKDEKVFFDEHVLDSLMALKSIKEGSRVLDIGTGAGLPGIPLAIFSNANFTLLDSLNKRIKIIEEFINEFEIPNVTLVHARVEDFAREKTKRESFDYCTSKAVAKLNVLMEYSAPLLKINARLLSFKSLKSEEEIDEAENAMRIFSFELKNKNSYTINDDKYRVILEFEKTAKTPNKYPRKTGQAQRNEIK